MTDGLGLGNAYGATLDRIKGQGGERSRLGMATLMWISHAERPLKPDDLCQALAVEIGSLDLNTDDVPSIGTLIACCQGLVFVDKEASTVRLIHSTLQEYLLAHPELFGTPHSTIAETCLGYLNSQQVKALSITPPPNFEEVPFLEYSSVYWGVHAKRDLSDCAKSLALKLFNDSENHISTRILLGAQEPWHRVDFNKPSLLSGLHCASIFGIDELVAGLVKVEGCDVNKKDCLGNTSLKWAAHYGHEGVVKILLGRGDINPDIPNNGGNTPLCWAAITGRDGVVKILLGQDDVNPDKPDNRGRTPLCWAAIKGYEGVVKILLGRDDVNPDKPNSDGDTPLHRAAVHGREGVVKILLGRDDVNPDKPNSDGDTPLHRAAVHGREGVVKILLGRGDLNPDKPDSDGDTPLHRAAAHGREGAVKILLGRDDVNPDKPNNNGETPLCYAALHGQEGVVKILLGRDDVNPDKPDKYGRTPHHYAVDGQHEGIIALLHSRKATARSTG